MGVIRIDRIATIELEDELLDHVFTVVIAKFRRREPVLLEWDDRDGRPRRAFVGPTCTLTAEWDSTEPGALDRTRLERLMVAANSTGGIRLTEAADEASRELVPAASIAAERAHENERESAA